METPTHSLLKRLSVAWLRSQGYLAAACEVRSPIAQWVLDVAGWRDSWFDMATGQRIKLVGGPQTIIIECKQSRADFLRDSRRFDALLALREKYQGIRESIEEHRIKALEPQLRRSGTSLFAEMEEWDFESSNLPAYRRTLQRLEQIDQRLHGQTKFFRLARYALADQLYVAAPAGLIARRELPRGWGLIECDVNQLWGISGATAANAGPPFSTRVEATALASRPQHRQRLLRNIAVAASAAMVRRDADESAAPPDSPPA